MELVCKYKVILVGQHDNLFIKRLSNYFDITILNTFDTSRDAVSFISKQDRFVFFLVFLGMDVEVAETEFFIRQIQEYQKVVDIVKISCNEYFQLDVSFFDLQLFGFLYYPYSEHEISLISKLYFEKFDFYKLLVSDNKDIIKECKLVAEHEKRYSVLIVDDEKDNCRNYQAFLKDSFDVFIAFDVETAFDIFQKNSIDIVLLDIGLPVRSGLDVLPDLFAMNPSIYIIMVTAFTEIDTIDYCFSQGAFSYLTKPFLKTTFKYLVERAVQAKQIRHYLTVYH